MRINSLSMVATYKLPSKYITNLRVTFCDENWVNIVIFIQHRVYITQKNMELVKLVLHSDSCAIPHGTFVKVGNVRSRDVTFRNFLCFKIFSSFVVHVRRVNVVVTQPRWHLRCTICRQECIHERRVTGWNTLAGKFYNFKYSELLWWSGVTWRSDWGNRLIPLTWTSKYNRLCFIKVAWIWHHWNVQLQILYSVLEKLRQGHVNFPKWRTVNGLSSPAWTH